MTSKKALVAINIIFIFKIKGMHVLQQMSWYLHSVNFTCDTLNTYLPRYDVRSITGDENAETLWASWRIELSYFTNPSTSFSLIKELFHFSLELTVYWTLLVLIRSSLQLLLSCSLYDKHKYLLLRQVVGKRTRDREKKNEVKGWSLSYIRGQQQATKST